MKMRPILLMSLTAAAVATSTLVIGGPASANEATRPYFQLPIACGNNVRMETGPTHDNYHNGVWRRDKAIDMYGPPAAGTPVLVAADGPAGRGRSRRILPQIGVPDQAQRSLLHLNVNAQRGHRGATRCPRFCVRQGQPTVHWKWDFAAHRVIDVALTERYGTFLRDPLGSFLHEIEHAGKPLTFDDIKSSLVRNGLSEQTVTWHWTRHERTIKDDAHVRFVPETRTYTWGPPVAIPGPTQAVHLLASGKAQINPDRKVLGDIVLAALHTDGREQAERQKIFEDRLKAESVRAYAKVAMELEELIAGGASARTLLQRIHAGAQAHGLRPIESAGATIRFDRVRHDPVVASTPDGSEVLVIRPGYLWQTGNEEVLVAKAVVIEQ